MTMPEEPATDWIKRTLFNLDFIHKRSTDNGPYEVTQLVNSFLGAFVFPWETFYRGKFGDITVEEAHDHWKIPILTHSLASDSGDPQYLRQVIRMTRNGIAHGHIRCSPDASNQIWLIEIWDEAKDETGTYQRHWGTRITLPQTREFLNGFGALALEFWSDQGRQVERRIGRPLEVAPQPSVKRLR